MNKKKFRAKRNCSVCDPFAHAPLKELTREMYDGPQKYTSSQHGNKCLKEEIRSVTKVGFVSKDKASFVRKDTTGHGKKISPGGSGFLETLRDCTSISQRT